ncbi:hypothetical protein BC938DRAFT_479670 [Jimgerdemannia flammicorona]|uniref:Uncharacterized protein n=1 Tax=Jimgerdemannia flammicorona TaxID=994334 RepID=A0A433QXX1_9FUNG|nr:hypothetical protein BC938DRAFT_479670 [Jimgerdemannia flammicorona]
MCEGYFRRRHPKDGGGNGDARDIVKGSETWWNKQVVLAGDDGYVYIMESETMKVANHLHVAHDHQVTKLLKIDYPVINVSRFRPRDAPHRVGDGGGDDATDYLLCTGHFNGVHVYKDGELVTIIETEDWVHTLAWGDVDGNGRDELVLGLLDQSVEVYGYEVVAGVEKSIDI